jgi:hypothetical protein
MQSTPPHPTRPQRSAGSGVFAHSDFRFLPDKNDAEFSQSTLHKKPKRAFLLMTFELLSNYVRLTRSLAQ